MDLCATCSPKGVDSEAITAPGCVLSSCATARELFMTAAGRESLDNGMVTGAKEVIRKLAGSDRCSMPTVALG